MRWYPTKTCCNADRTFTSTVKERRRSGETKRARMIMHVKGDARFWHWSDQDIKVLSDAWAQERHEDH